MHEVLLDGVAPVATEVATDRARGGDRRVGGAGQRAEALDHAVALDHHRHDRSGQHELDERLVERLALVLGVVGGEQLAGRLAELEPDQPVALRLDAPDHLAGQATATPSGLTRTRERSMGRTLSSGRQPPQWATRRSTSSGHRALAVGLDRAGGDRQRDDAGPGPGGDVLGLVPGRRRASSPTPRPAARRSPRSRRAPCACWRAAWRSGPGPRGRRSGRARGRVSAGSSTRRPGPMTTAER